MLSSDRNSHRRVFIRAWGNARARQPLTPLEIQIVEILRQHPEYQPFLEADDNALDRDFSPEQGTSNPFLHLGLHLAILEQVSIDQPAGIRHLYQTLTQRTGDPHAAEHRLMDCLAEGLWTLQRGQQPFNEHDYLDCIKRGSGT